LQAPQNIATAQQTFTSQYSSEASLATTVSGNQVTVTVPARSISTVVLTL
jgi:hypothetical protein